MCGNQGRLRPTPEAAPAAGRPNGAAAPLHRSRQAHHTTRPLHSRERASHRESSSSSSSCSSCYLGWSRRSGAPGAGGGYVGARASATWSAAWASRSPGLAQLHLGLSRSGGVAVQRGQASQEQHGQEHNAQDRGRPLQDHGPAVGHGREADDQGQSHRQQLHRPRVIRMDDASSVRSSPTCLARSLEFHLVLEESDHRGRRGWLGRLG